MARLFLLDPRVRGTLFLLWWLLWTWVVYLSLVSVQLAPGVSDKSLHFVGYVLLSAGAVGFCHDQRRLVLWALFGAATGGALEIAQTFTSDRSGDLLDFAADAAGAALGCLTGQAWLTLVIHLSRRP